MSDITAVSLSVSAEISSEEVEEAVNSVGTNILDTVKTLLSSVGVSTGGLSVSKILFSLVSSLVILAACLLIMKILLRFVDQLLQNSKIDKSLHAFVRSGTKIVAWVLTAILVVGSLGVDVSSLVAVLSVAGLAVSLALQNSLSNVAGGIMILISKPFEVGDLIECGDSTHFGTVKEIDLTYTKIQTVDKKLISIPNSTVSSANITNYTSEGYRLVVQTYDVAYENDIDNVKHALRIAIGRSELAVTDPEHEPFIHISAFGESAVTYTIRVWCRTADYWDLHFFLLEEVFRVFHQQGVIITYNRLNVELVNADGSQLDLSNPQKPDWSQTSHPNAL